MSDPDILINVFGINRSPDRFNLGNSIITGLTFISILAWIEVLFFDIRHAQDVISNQEGYPESLPRIEQKKHKLRMDFSIFALGLTVITVLAIKFFRAHPLRV
jgi:hypothetical protein